MVIHACPPAQPLAVGGWQRSWPSTAKPPAKGAVGTTASKGRTIPKANSTGLLIRCRYAAEEKNRFERSIVSTSFATS